MSPRTDHMQELADLLAVIMGKESPTSVYMDKMVMTKLWNKAHALWVTNHIAIQTQGNYTIVKHAKIWQRRVR